MLSFHMAISLGVPLIGFGIPRSRHKALRAVVENRPRRLLMLSKTRFFKFAVQALSNCFRVMTSSSPMSKALKMLPFINSSDGYILFLSFCRPSINCFGILLICGQIQLHVQTLGWMLSCCRSIRACNNSFYALRSCTCCWSILTIACVLLSKVRWPVLRLPPPPLPLPILRPSARISVVPIAAPVALLACMPWTVLGAALMPPHGHYNDRKLGNRLRWI